MKGRVHFAGLRPDMAVMLERPVGRYPHFRAEAGLTGIVVEATEGSIALRLDQPLEGAGPWDNQIHWSAANGGAAEIEQFFAETRRTDRRPWGPDASTLESNEFRHELARLFAVSLLQDLEPDQLAEINEANLSAGEGECASYDIVDGNMNMLLSLSQLVGPREQKLTRELQQAWDAAWSLAKHAKFCPPALVPAARYFGEWGAGFVNQGSGEREGSYFVSLNGYSHEDMAQISALVVGQTWTCPTHPSHNVTRRA